MEDQDRETKPEEEVEGHSHYSPRKDAPRKDQNDEGDDVEGHVHYAPRKDAPRKD